MAKVSIIVPVYNVEKYLRKCMDSLVNQTLKDIEIVVVNDGSPDHSDEIMQEYLQKYSCIKYVRIENGGVANARNVALSMASGDFVAFCDSDDYVDLDMYESLYNKAIESGAEVILSGYYDEDDFGNYRLQGLGNLEEYGQSLVENPKMIFANNAFIHGKLFSRSLIDKHQIGFRKYRIFEDLLFLNMALLFANKVEKVDRAFYHYMRRENSSVTGKMNDKFYDLFPVMQDLKDVYIQNGYTNFQEYLTFIALKHAYIRFRMAVSKETRSLKRQYIMDTYAFLDVYDANWKGNAYFKRNKNVNFLYYTVGYWMLYPLLLSLKKGLKG